MSRISGSGADYIGQVSANYAREQEIKRMYGFTERDRVQVYTLPKNHIGKKYGSRTYTPSSMKSRRLQQELYALKGKIISTENSAELSHKEKAQKLGELRTKLKYTSVKLNAELASLPAVGAIVLEAEA